LGDRHVAENRLPPVFACNHPGSGGDVVLEVAGADGTVAFEEQSHSGYAKSQLPRFLIGRIAD